VFHASLLTPYTETPSHGPNFTWLPLDLIDGEEEYKVEQIHSHQTWGRHRTLQYLIKWKGYPKSDNTWENADQIHAPALIKLYHQTTAQKAIRARRIYLGRYQLPNLDSTTTVPRSLPYLPIIIRDSTAALVWSTTYEDNIRLACSPHAPPVRSLLAPWVHTMLPTSCATQMVSKLILQTSTRNKDNLLYVLRPLAPASLTQCPPQPLSMHQINHLTRLCSNYPHDTPTHQPQLHSPPIQSKPLSSCSLTSTLPYSEASPMASSKPSPTEKLPPPSQTNDTKTDSMALSSMSSTTRIPSTSP
jgi:hypothetical protein